MNRNAARIPLVLCAALLLACPAPDEPEPPELEGCADEAGIREDSEDLQAWFEALSEGLSANPVGVVLGEDTNGTLSLGLAGRVLPLLKGPLGLHGAAATLGEGRVAVFSGQDFLSSGTRSTLLQGTEVPELLRNAVRWSAGGRGGLEVLVDNVALREVLTAGTQHSVAVSPVVEQVGLREIRDWSASALAGKDVLVVQVNEWGTLHVADEDVPAIREFVDQGGGLVLAGSALHWSWWLSDQGPEFPGDAILEGTGLSFERSSIRDLSALELVFDEHAAPEALWCAYVNGDSVAAGDLPRLPALFQGAADSGRGEEVDDALDRLIRDTPDLPVRTSNAVARLSADVAVLLRGHPWPQAHPWGATFPGAVSDGATATDTAVSIDTTWKRTRPLGLYAPGGAVVTVELPEAHAGAGLSLRVGERYDDLRYLDNFDEWRRAPLILQVQPVESARTVVGNGLGGALYLEVPDDYPDASFEVSVSGAVPMATWVHGESTEQGFSADLAKGAPQAILMERGKVRMVVDAGMAAQVTDPAATVTFWTGFIDHHIQLASEPAPRAFESHWIFDPQVGYGYANATAARITYPELATGWALRTETGNEDWWLFGHELGHQFQTSDWSGGDVTEVCVNLFTMYTLNAYINGGGNFETRGHNDNMIDHVALQSARWSSEGLFGKLEMYRQLVFEFGWDAYEETFASYYDPAYPRGTYGSFMDGFALRFSAIVGRDITPFLDSWEYPYSASARAAIQGWGLSPWVPPGW